METITIEKIIKFDSEIDSINNIEINDELRYSLKEDDSYATGLITLSGSVNTLLGKKEFKDDVDVDIYAPFDKKLDKENFKIKVKDYSYVVKNNNLIIYMILQFDGIIDNTVINNQTILEEINTLNEINEDSDSSTREESKNEINIVEPVKLVEEVKEVKQEKVNIIESKKIDKINDNWSKDLFKLNDTNVIFHKYKLK